jgi:hypothetical protein
MIIDSPIISGSSAASGSLNQFGNVTITGSVNVSGSFTSTGTLTAQTLIVQTITSSVVYSSGSNIFGNDLANTQRLTGSVSITGSLAVNGSNAVLSNQTSSMSASYALNATSASYANNATSASYANNATTASYALVAAAGGFPFTGSAQITGSLGVTGSINVTGSITGSLLGTASYASTANSAPLYLPLAGGTMTGDISAAGRTFTFQYLVLGSGTTEGRISTDGGKPIRIFPTSGVESARFLANGNVIIQNGGTYTDNGFKLDVSGSGRFTNGLNVTGAINATSFTGSHFGTSSYANYSLTSSYSLAGSGFPFSGSAVITGSLLVTNLSSSGVSYLVADAAGFVTAQTASAAIKSTQAVTSTAGQTSFNITNGYTTGLVDVYINGTKLSAVEYTDTSGTVITLATGSNNGDTVEFVKYFPASGVTNNALRQQTTITASAGQTVFSASYTPGLLDIYYNGSRLSTSDYTANSGTYFTLATASAASDILDVLVYSYQVGAFSGIGGVGVANQFAYFTSTNAVTSSTAITISGANAIVTGSLLGNASYSNDAGTLYGLD